VEGSEVTHGTKVNCNLKEDQTDSMNKSDNAALVDSVIGNFQALQSMIWQAEQAGIQEEALMPARAQLAALQASSPQ